MTDKDKALLDYIIDGTEKGTVHWESTAGENEFLATLRGAHSVMITRMPSSAHDVLSLRNAEGQEILSLSGGDDQRINRIFFAARRNAYNVDKAIDEILGPDSPSAPVTDEDIPF